MMDQPVEYLAFRTLSGSTELGIFVALDCHLVVDWIGAAQRESSDKCWIAGKRIWRLAIDMGALDSYENIAWGNEMRGQSFPGSRTQ